MGPQGTDTESTEVEVEDTATDLFDPDLHMMQELSDELDRDDSDTDTDEDESESGTDDSDTEDTDDGDLFVVKVDGEEIEVTRDELLKGYSRQQDYTKKTQALAAERERLQGLEQLAQALSADPAAAISEMAKAFGVELGTPSERVEEGFELDPTDPIERELLAVRQELAALKGQSQTWEQEQAQRRQAEEDAAIEREIQQIAESNQDPDLDPNELVQFAVDNQVFNLSAAYRLYRMENPVQAKTETNEALERKRKAPPVEGSRGRRGAKSGGGRITSIEDALKAAMQELNG